MNSFTSRIVAFLVGAALPLAAAWPQEPPKAPLLVSVDAGLSQEWQLPTTHFVRAKMPMTLVHPRPDSETNTWARHRKAYPGLEYRIPVAVQGGAYPFYYEILEGPEEMTIGRTVWDMDYGVLSWTPDDSLNGQEFPVTIRIYGQEYERETAETVGSAFVDASFVVRVTDSTEDFIFVDGSVESSGDGSIGAPLKTLKETYGDGDDEVVTYPGRAVYLRAGVYETLTDDWFANKGYAFAEGTRTPVVFLGYPGEAVEIDFTNGTIYSGMDGFDFYAGGLTLRNTSQRARGYHGVSDVRPNGSRMFTIGNHRQTFFENHFINSRAQYLDYSQAFGFERASDSEFRATGGDLTDALNANSRWRVYSDATNYLSVRIQSSSFDGTDTLATVYLDSGDPPVLPATIATAKRYYDGGNDGFINSNRSTYNKPYHTFWGNQVDDYQVGVDKSGHGGGIGPFYMHEYLVFEANSFGYGEGHNALILKTSNDFASIRRNDLLQPAGNAQINVYGGSAASGEPDFAARTEVCYNKFRPDAFSKALDLFGTAAERPNPYEAWIYRNTILGRVQTFTWGESVIQFEKNLIFTDDASPYRNRTDVQVEGDQVYPTAAVEQYLDSGLNLAGQFREENLGLIGYEISK